MAYIGSSPTKVVSRQSANIFTYTATANQTAFTGADANGNTLACSPSDIMVHMNGIKLEESDYTATTTTVTLGSGAAVGDEVTITAFLTFESADHYTKSAADTRYVNTTGDTMSGVLSISTSGNSSMTLQTSSASNSVSTNFQSANRTYYAGVDIGGANSSFTVYDGTAGAERFRIDASGRVTMPNQPCFHARRTGGHGTTGTIVFDTADVNVGNHYSTSTGNFTAPIAGKYLLFTTVLSAAGVNVGADMKINGTRYAVTEESWPNTSSTYRSTSITAIASLSANDAVRVENKQGGYYGSSAYTFFGGYLLGQEEHMSNARKLADNLPSEGRLGNRNLIINGAMEVAQRGTSQSNANPAIGSVDRMRFALSGGTGTMSQQTMSASDRSTTGFDKYLRLDLSAGNNNAGLYYNVEAADILHAQGKKLTLSFWAKGTNPAGGSFVVPHYWYDGSNQDDGASESLTITSSWAKYAITFDTATASSVSLTSVNARYDIAILQPNADTSTNAWQLDITGLMLEVGSQASPFEYENITTTLSKCQRYYAKIEGPVHGYACWSYSNVTSTHFSLPEKMRTVPSVTFTGTNNTGTNDAVTNDTFSLYNHNTWLGTSSGNGTQYGGTSASSTQSIRINTYPHSSFTSNGISVGLYFGQNCSINADAEF